MNISLWRGGFPIIGLLLLLIASCGSMGQVISETLQADAHNRRGAEYSRLGKYEDAIREYRLAVSLISRHTEGARREQVLNPRQAAMYHSNLASSYLALSRCDEGAQHLEVALRFKPDYHYGLTNLGALYTCLGKYEEAIDALRKALRIQPDFWQAHLNLGGALGQMRRHEEAIKEYEEAIRLNPLARRGYIGLGESYMKLRRKADATPHFRKAREILEEEVKKDPKVPYNFYLLGETLILGELNFAEGLDFIQKALEMSPDTPLFIAALGWGHFKQGELEKAIAYLERASKKAPLDVKISRRLSEAKEALALR